MSPQSPEPTASPRTSPLKELLVVKNHGGEALRFASLFKPRNHTPSLFKGALEPEISRKALLSEAMALQASSQPHATGKILNNLLAWLDEDKKNGGSFSRLPLGDVNKQRIYACLLCTAIGRNDAQQIEALCKELVGVFCGQDRNRLLQPGIKPFVLEIFSYLISKQMGHVCAEILAARPWQEHIRLAYEMVDLQDGSSFPRSLQFHPDLIALVQQAKERVPDLADILVREKLEMRGEIIFLCSYRSLILLGRVADSLAESQAQELPPGDKVEAQQDLRDSQLAGLEQELGKAFHIFVQQIRKIPPAGRQTLIAYAISYCSQHEHWGFLEQFIPALLHEHKATWLVAPLAEKEKEGSGNIALQDQDDKARRELYKECLKNFVNALESGVGLSGHLRSAGMFHMPNNPIVAGAIDKAPIDLHLLLLSLESDLIDISVTILSREAQPQIADEHLGELLADLESFLNIFDRHCARLSGACSHPSQESSLNYTQTIQYTLFRDPNPEVSLHFYQARDLFSRLCSFLNENTALFQSPGLRERLLQANFFTVYGSADSNLCRNAAMLNSSYIQLFRYLGAHLKFGESFAGKEANKMAEALAEIDPCGWLEHQSEYLRNLCATREKASEKEEDDHTDLLQALCKDTISRSRDFFHRFCLQDFEAGVEAENQEIDRLYNSLGEFICRANKDRRTEEYAHYAFVLFRSLLDHLPNPQARLNIWSTLVRRVGSEILKPQKMAQQAEEEQLESEDDGGAEPPANL